MKTYTVSLRALEHAPSTQQLPAVAVSTHLQRDAVDDVQRIDDVAERLAHLAAVLVADHGVQVDLTSHHT